MNYLERIEQADDPLDESSSAAPDDAPQAPEQHAAMPPHEACPLIFWQKFCSTTLHPVAADQDKIFFPADKTAGTMRALLGAQLSDISFYRASSFRLL
ncbi:hypothetical protein D3C78_711280 [compost metagenome]